MGVEGTGMAETGVYRAEVDRMCGKYVRGTVRIRVVNW